MGRELGYSGAELQTFVKEEKAEIRQREKEQREREEKEREREREREEKERTRTRKRTRRKRKRTGRKTTEKRSGGTRETSSTSTCKNKCRNRDLTRK